jgi:hypothetical protein
MALDRVGACRLVSIAHGRRALSNHARERLFRPAIKCRARPTDRSFLIHALGYVAMDRQGDVPTAHCREPGYVVWPQSSEGRQGG